jgi:hypothetical protein
MSHNLPQLVTPPAAAAAIASSSAAAAAGGQKPATSSFRRKILTQNDMAQWTQSEAYTNIERFIIRLRDASTRPVSQSEVQESTPHCLWGSVQTLTSPLSSRNSSSSGSMHS